jgi:hypothetical protein
VLAQSPDTGILCYGDTTIKHDNQDNVVLEFLDFYRAGTGTEIKYLVFDSKFTTLKNLWRINQKGIKFITIQQRSKTLNEKIAQIPASDWKSVRIEQANHKHRSVTYSESTTANKRYGPGEIRQIFVKGNHVKPATIITNEFSLSAADIIRKYSQRVLIETEISEHIEFFHLNRNSSGIVVKADFDLTMSILSHNLYRFYASTLPGYSHCAAKTLFHKFIQNNGDIIVGPDTITVKMNLKRTLPLTLESLFAFNEPYQWIGGKRISFVGKNNT